MYSIKSVFHFFCSAAAQCAHAAVGAYKKALRYQPAVLKKWERDGQAKITLKADTEEVLEGAIQR